MTKGENEEVKMENTVRKIKQGKKLTFLLLMICGHLTLTLKGASNDTVQK